MLVEYDSDSDQLEEDIPTTAAGAADDKAVSYAMPVEGNGCESNESSSDCEDGLLSASAVFSTIREADLVHLRHFQAGGVGDQNKCADSDCSRSRSHRSRSSSVSSESSSCCAENHRTSRSVESQPEPRSSCFWMPGVPAHSSANVGKPKPYAFHLRDHTGGATATREDSADMTAAKEEALQRLDQIVASEPQGRRRQKAFKNLLRTWHPDKNSNRVEIATAVFQLLQKSQSKLTLT